MWVGLVNLLGDSTLYYSSAAAWCYWCMPADLLRPEVQDMRRYAEWIRQITLDECVAIVHRAWLDADVNDAVDSVLSRLIDHIRYAAERRESIVDSIWLPQPDTDRDHPAVLQYEERPSGVGTVPAGPPHQVEVANLESPPK
jgi:hypothetical protein